VSFFLIVAEANPIKQGLKLVSTTGSTTSGDVAEANPIKQGLKQVIIKFAILTYISCRG